MRTSTGWLRLYLVLDPDACTGNVVETAVAAIEAGITCLQLRWKSATDKELMGLAAELARICGQANVPFIVNDRVDIALAAGANGVHLGVDDLPIIAAASLGGPGFLIGYSPENDEQVRGAEQLGAAYLGIGPFESTTTKPDAGLPLGAIEFQRRRSLTVLPVVAIGGITPNNAQVALAAGANGIAVASAISRSQDPGSETRRLLDSLTASS